MIFTWIPPVDCEKEPIEIFIDPEWFLQTNPSFTNIERYIPEWEDKNDECVAFSYFLIWHFGPEVSERNAHILCYDAIEALREFNIVPEW